MWGIWFLNSFGLDFSWSYLKKSRRWHEQTAKITERRVKRRLGNCWRFFTKKVTFATWAHEAECKSAAVRFARLISTFQRKWKRTEDRAANQVLRVKCSNCVANTTGTHWGRTLSQHHGKKSHYEDWGTKLSCWMGDGVETPEFHGSYTPAEPPHWSSSAPPLTPHRNTAVCIGDTPIRKSACLRCFITDKSIHMDILITR